jgi:hypothetical protein
MPIFVHATSVDVLSLYINDKGYNKKYLIRIDNLPKLRYFALFIVSNFVINR